MKKVLVFVPEFPKLTETFIERELSKLVSLNQIDIVVFSIKKATGKLSDNLVDRVIYKRPCLLDLAKGFFYFCFTYPKRVIVAFKLILGKDRMPFILRKLYFIKAFGYAWVFKQFSPDQIHAHFLSWPSTVGMISATLLGVPYSISAHARDVMVDGTLIPSKVKTAKFITICNKFAWKSCIEQSGIESPSNVVMQYHGVDISALPKDRDRNPQSKSKRPYIFVGSRLVEKKGICYVIEASRILKDRGIDFEVHIVGPGPLYKDLVSKINSLEVADRVFIHGEGKGLPWRDIVEIFKIANIFAHPSINTNTGDADGVPNFVIEAAICKIPVVTTDAGSITDLIKNEDTGLIVKQSSSEDLANALERLINDYDLRAKLGNSAHEKAKELFDIDKNVLLLQDLLSN